MQADILLTKEKIVSINTLNVGMKQMTLSTFRQIPAEHIFDFKEFVIKGEILGHVNYWWDKFNKDSSGDIHLLWKKANELRRAKIRHPNNYFVLEEINPTYQTLYDKVLASEQLFIAV